MAAPAGNPGTPAHLRNVLGALSVAVADLIIEAGEARGFIAAEQAAIIVAGTVDGISQEDLQHRLGLSQPGTTRLVDRLADRGVLIRAPGRQKRTNALRLTAAGRAEARAALASRHRLLDPLISGLPAAEQHAAAELIDRMLGALVNTGRSPWRICRLCDQAACDSTAAGCPVDAARLSESTDADSGTQS